LPPGAVFFQAALRRQSLQAKGLAALLRIGRDAVGDQTAKQLRKPLTPLKRLHLLLLLNMTMTVISGSNIYSRLPPFIDLTISDFYGCLLLVSIVSVFLFSPASLSAEGPDHNALPLHSDVNQEKTLSNAAKDLRWELGGMSAGILYFGLKEWNWGSSSFNYNSEGWFGADTGSGGADKLGHLYSAFVMDEFLTNRLYDKSRDMKYAAKSGAVFSWGLMLAVEISDGFSDDHGFSHEDLIMNTAGIAASYLKNTVPNLDDKFDLRLEYKPSKGMQGFHPVTDYSGMKYLAVAKLAGFDLFKSTSLKYLELHLGYYTRGFKKEDKPYYNQKLRELYFGVGLDLQEVIFKPLMKKTKHPSAKYLNTFFRYYQPPGSYVDVPLNTLRD
jgi:hypothetical protein